MFCCEVPFSLNRPLGKLNMSNPEVLTVRWAAAFLCSVGNEWISVPTKPMPRILLDELRKRTLLIDVKHRHTGITSLSRLLKAWENYETSSGAFGSNILVALWIVQF